MTRSLQTAGCARAARGVLVILLLAANACAWAQGVASPLLAPAAVAQGVATTVTVRALVSAVNLIPGSVNVQRLEPGGQVTVLGLLNDSGSAGDLKAGDGIYSGQVVVNQATEGTVGLRVSFATRGSLKRTLSPVALLAVVPADAPRSIAPPALAGVTTDLASGAPIVGGRVNACFTAGTPYATVKAVGLLAGGTPVGSMALLGNCYQFSLSATDAATVAAATALLAARSEVLFAEPEFVLEGKTSCAAGNPFCADVNFTQVLDLDTAHNYGEGQGVTIGILDTGMSAVHIGGSLLFPGMIVGSNFITPGDLPVDDHPPAHGTTVAAIAQATAPKATLFIAKVLNASMVGDESTAVAGMVEAAGAGARIVNLSLGGFTQTAWMRNALNVIQSAGVIIVAAAGNEGTSRRVYPAAHLNVIAVGNTDEKDKRWDGPLLPTNFGPWVNIAAPGVDVAATPGATGTSFSAPWVTGTVALMLAKYGPMSTAQVRDQLFRTAMPIPANATLDTCPAQPCNQDLGSGRVDPSAALGAIRLTRDTAVGASGAAIPRSIDVSIRTGTGVTIFATTMTFLGQSNGCQVITVKNPPCIASIPFDFAALAPGAYQLRLSFPAQPASYFGKAQITAPGATFTSVALGTGSVNATDPTRAEYSLFGAGTSRTTIFNIVKP